MNDPFDHLAHLQRQLGGIAAQLTRVQFTYFTAAERWRPAINAYHCGNQFVICVDLAGADQSATEVVAEPRRLIIRGERPPPGPPCDQSETVHVLEMEIDYGPFERVVELPADIHPNRVKAEYREGLLWVSLPLRGL
jgi:HSP20 family protein